MKSCWHLGSEILIATFCQKVIHPVGKVEDCKDEREEEPRDDIDSLGAAWESAEDGFCPAAGHETFRVGHVDLTMSGAAIQAVDETPATVNVQH